MPNKTGLRFFILPIFTITVILSTSVVYHLTQFYSEEYAQAEQLFKAGGYSSALGLFEDVHKARPRDLNTIHYLFLIYYRTHDIKNARGILKDALQYFSDDPFLLEQTVDLCLWEKEYGCAIAGYSKMLENNRGNREVQLKLADALRFAGRHEEAARLYKEYLHEN